jgi:hypothetical protein
MLVESYKGAVTELLGPADVPGDVLGSDTMKLLRKNGTRAPPS